MYQQVSKTAAVRPIKCKLCFRRFKYESSLYFHVNSIHAEMLFHWRQRRLQKRLLSQNQTNGFSKIGGEPIRISVIKRNPL